MIAGLVIAALATGEPLEGRLGVAVLPMSGPALGAELEVGYRTFPLTLGLRSVATFPTPPMPAFHSLTARTTPVHPGEGPAFGLLGAAAMSAITGSPGGTRTNIHVALGATYQQAWGGAWLRLSPNVLLPFDLMATLMIAPPWLEFGYRLGDFDVSLRTTATPLGVAWRF